VAVAVASGWVGKFSPAGFEVGQLGGAVQMEAPHLGLPPLVGAGPRPGSAGSARATSGSNHPAPPAPGLRRALHRAKLRWGTRVPGAVQLLEAATSITIAARGRAMVGGATAG